jgi:transaldolase
MSRRVLRARRSWQGADRTGDGRKRTSSRRRCRANGRTSLKARSAPRRRRTFGGRAAVAQGKLAHQLSRDRFCGPRRERLAALGAHCQRPLWASTSTKTPPIPTPASSRACSARTRVNTLPEANDRPVRRPRHVGLDHRRECRGGRGHDATTRRGRRGMEDVGLTLETEGVASFHKSFREVLAALHAKARQPTRHRIG